MAYQFIVTGMMAKHSTSMRRLKPLSLADGGRWLLPTKASLHALAVFSCPDIDSAIKGLVDKDAGAQFKEGYRE